MRIRDVDFPAELVDAHRDGRLVLFIGAGASIAPPSGLPTFQGLTAEIAAESGVMLDDEQLDRFLGVLQDDRHVDVHARVAAKIGDSSSQPNKLHEAIIALATASPVPRIVTTNYDAHLTTVLETAGRSLPEHLAPALPMGDDFDGVVYLHGKLGQHPSRLVVTDEDFGRAYLRDAWAARFLERMFATHMVLFIGYSHGDVVMSYLARGLRAESVRYTLTDVPHAARWRSLRITPILYEVVDGSHHLLEEALHLWARRSSMGLLDHRQRIAELTSAEPSGIPEDESYLEEAVADGGRVNLFTEFARGPAWLTWVAGQSEFRHLFDPSATATECTQSLAWWFAQKYVMSDELSDAALEVTQRAGGRLSPTLRWAIGQALHAADGPRPLWLAPWLVLLVENAPDHADDWLALALMKSQWPADRASALLLLDHLTEPRVSWERSFASYRSVRADIRLRGDDYWLREGWGSVLHPRLAEVAPEILPIADQHLRRTYLLMRAARSADTRWDPLSFGRSTIEHQQDRRSKPIDILIDIARDCLESMLDGTPVEGAAWLRMWASSDMPLLRRLAVHGWIQRSDVSPTDKLTWLIDRGWLFDVRLRHEVFRFIETVLSSADPVVANRLVEQALAGPQPADEHRDYEIFNALVWLTRSAPGLSSGGEALDRMKAAHPEWDEREHPDLTWSLEVGFVPSNPPMSTQALHELIERDAAAAITELRRYEETHRPFNTPTWEDAVAVLAGTVSMWPADGFAVLDAAGGDHPDIVRGVIRGWSTASVDVGRAEAIADRLGELALAVAGVDVARLLEEGGRVEGSPTEWHRLPAARRLAATTWDALPDEPSKEGIEDWLTWAINRPAGQLAEFWTYATSGDWATARDAGATWQGLTPELCAPLETMLAGDDSRTAAAEVVLASQLNFFHAADQDWARKRLLPLFDWAAPARARRAWDGFLFAGRPSDRLLHAGLLDRYLETATHTSELRDEVRRQLAEHLAAVALRSEIDPVATRWPWTLTSTSTEETRSEWLERIGWLLGRLPPDAIKHQWRRWMQPYWQDRVASVPTQLTRTEADAMAKWLVHLREPESIRAGVVLAVARSAGLTAHSDILHDLDDEQIALEPAAYARLLTHLLRHTEPPFYDRGRLPALVTRLRELLGREAVLGIVEQALRLNYSGAADW